MKPEQLISSPMGDAEGNDEFDDEIVVEVVDDTPEDDQGRSGEARSSEEHDEELTNVSQKVQKRIKKLKYEFHEERRGKEAASRLRDEAVNYAKKVQNENQSLRDLVSRGEQVLMDEVKAGAARELETAKVQLKQAHEEGDSESIVNAQEILSRASYDSQKAQELVPVEQPQTQAAPPPPQRQQAVEPKAEEWHKKNTWFRSDREMTAFATAVHENLVSTGVDTKSDNYYASIDEKMRERFPEKFDGDEDLRPNETPRTQVPRKKPPSVVAPARRAGGGSQKQVRLTKTQVKLASKLGVSPEDYAKQVVLLENSNG
jgi:hypothetical protein